MRKFPCMASEYGFNYHCVEFFYGETNKVGPCSGPTDISDNDVDI